MSQPAPRRSMVTICQPARCPCEPRRAEHDATPTTGTRAPPGPKICAAEALEVFETRKITTLFVVDGAGRPEGVVHFHDLLKVGAA